MHLTKQTHLIYIKECGPFKLKGNRSIFSNSEIELLEKFGHWFAALEDGTLEPITQQQQYFVDVTKGIKDPISIEEFAWLKFKSWRKQEWERKKKYFSTKNKRKSYYQKENEYLIREYKKEIRHLMNKKG